VSGVLIRLVRVNLLQTMRGDYVEAARARGIKERRVVIHHAFRNALVPVITVAGLQLAILLGGAVLTEQSFNWPGIGAELVRYLNERDYIAVQGIITVFALAVVIVSLLIDVVNAFVDPRVRY
jgi:peptide/nickel transport system permease protein